MTTNDPLYTSNILKQAIISYLDQNVPKTEQGLTILVSQCDDLVWNIATYIYTNSGYQVEFSVIRDIIHDQIQPFKKYVADRNAEEARRLAEEIERNQIEAIRLVEKNRRLAEENRTKREKEAIRLAEEAKIKQEQEAIRLAEEAKRKQEEEAIRLTKKYFLQELKTKCKKMDETEILSYLFSQIQSLVSKKLEIPLEKVSLDSHLVDDFGADSLECLEVIIAIEEHFYIEITEAILAEDPITKKPKTKIIKSSGFGSIFAVDEHYSIEYEIEFAITNLLNAVYKILTQVLVST